jgi:hypothetical protein
MNSKINKEKEELYLKRIKNCSNNYDWLIKKIMNKTPFTNKVLQEIEKINSFKVIRVYRKFCKKE